MPETADLELRRENPKSSERFVGSWTLVSFEHVPPSGEVLKPFGDSPAGLILYHPDGHMSAQVSAGSRKKLACEDPLEASPEEAAEAWRTYFGYWGSFAVDAEKRVVVHRVEGSSFPNWIGTEQVRHFRFDGANRLILETQFPSGHSTVIWQRISD
ncbi:MAG: lipocalin-like domain-containing protein [Acidobacteriaceae bacterium]|nr:lipocalin-like domain-containing protein [Acidobacteriaceae bacterium]